MPIINADPVVQIVDGDKENIHRRLGDGDRARQQAQGKPTGFHLLDRRVHFRLLARQEPTRKNITPSGGISTG